MLTQRFIQRRVDAARKAINIRLRASDVPSTRDSISPPRETSLDRSPRETPALTPPVVVDSRLRAGASGRAGAPARHWLRVIPSFFMRDRSVLCPETTCSTRPSQASGAPGGWARNCTTKARLVGSGSGELGHQQPPATPRPGGAFSRCPRHARKIQYARRSSPEPKRSNWGGRGQGSVSKLCKLQRREAQWHPSTRAPLGPFRLEGTPGRLWQGDR